MGKNKKGAPVVIVRKDKRLRKGLHLAAFALTGGASGVVTAAKAATNAGYNARTRKLAAEAEEMPEPALRRADRGRGVRMRPTDAEKAEFRAEHVPASREYKQRHGR